MAGIPDNTLETCNGIRQVFEVVPVYLPNDDDAGQIGNAQVKSGCGASVTLLTIPVTKCIQGLANEELRKRTVEKFAKELIKKFAKETTEEIAEDVAKKVAEKVIKKFAKEATEEIAESSSRAAFGIRAGFIGGAFVEVVSFTASVYVAKGQMDRGEISESQFHQHVTKRAVAGAGAVTGSTIGAAVGTVLIPIPFVGAFAGTLVGGFCGELVGSMVGTEIGREMFQ